MPNRTLQAKRWKMKAQATRHAIGDHAKHSPNPRVPAGMDSRDGRVVQLPEGKSKAELRVISQLVTMMHVPVTVVKPAKADGLHADYANKGKRGNHAWVKTFGDGTRRKQGIGFDQFTW